MAGTWRDGYILGAILLVNTLGTDIMKSIIYYLGGTRTTNSTKIDKWNVHLKTCPKWH